MLIKKRYFDLYKMGLKSEFLPGTEGLGKLRQQDISQLKAKLFILNYICI
jgi:hypothetical protein